MQPEEILETDEYIKLNYPELYELINGGVLSFQAASYEEEEKLKNDCYMFISMVKWSYGFKCRNERCKRDKERTDYFEILLPEEVKMTYKHDMPYSLMCKACFVRESPTANTRLHKMTPINILFEFISWLLSQRDIGRLSDSDLSCLINHQTDKPKLPNRRGKRVSKKGNDKNDEIYQEREKSSTTYIQLLDKKYHLLEMFLNISSKDGELSEIYKKNANYHVEQITGQINKMESNNGIRRISESKIKEYRYMIQQYINDWTEGSGTEFAKSPYGLQKFWLSKGKCRKLVIVSRQLRPNGHIRAKVYDEDSIDVFYDFARNYIPENAHIILYDWDEKYRNEIVYGSLLEFDRFYIDFDIHSFQVQDVTHTLKEWFSKSLIEELGSSNNVITTLSLKDNERVQLHINECLFIKYYVFLNVSLMVARLIHYPSKELYKREKKRTVCINNGPFSIYNEIKKKE